MKKLHCGHMAEICLPAARGGCLIAQSVPRGDRRVVRGVQHRRRSRRDDGLRVRRRYIDASAKNAQGWPKSWAKFRSPIGQIGILGLTNGGGGQSRNLGQSYETRVFQPCQGDQEVGPNGPLDIFKNIAILSHWALNLHKPSPAS